MIPGVGGCLFRQGCLLLIRRALPPEAGRFAVPGGKVRAGETPEQAIVREMAEELGLQVVAVREIFAAVQTFDGTAYRLTDFLLREEGGVLRPGREVAEVRWVGPAECSSLPLAGGMEELLRAIRWGEFPGGIDR